MTTTCRKYHRGMYASAGELATWRYPWLVLCKPPIEVTTDLPFKIVELLRVRLCRPMETIMVKVLPGSPYLIDLTTPHVYLRWTRTKTICAGLMALMCMLLVRRGYNTCIRLAIYCEGTYIHVTCILQSLIAA